MSAKRPTDWAYLEQQRRERLKRFLELDAPPIILNASMRLLAQAQRKVHGKGYFSPVAWRSHASAWWWTSIRRGRCECGGVIWPWQKTAYDEDLGPIHLECAGETGDSEGRG